MKSWCAAGLVVGLLLQFSHVLWASEESDVLTGVEGQSLIAALASPLDPKVVLVGTADGLYATRDIASGEFERIKGFTKEKCRVVALAPDGEVVRVATERGAYIVSWKTLEARSIFGRFDPAQRSVYSVRRLGSFVFVASRGGLFMGDPDGRSWSKIQGPWLQRELVYLEVLNDAVFAATEQGVYRSNDAGRTWEKVLDVGSNTEPVEAGGTETVETGSSDRILATAAGSTYLFVATSTGVKRATADGAGWEDVVSAGCDVSSMRCLYYDVTAQTLFALTGSGVYAMKADGWTRLVSTGFGRDIFRHGEKISVLTERGIRDLEMSPDPAKVQATETTVKPSPDPFANEPSVQEVQAMAIAYAEVDKRKIDDWRRRASVKAILPEIDVSYDKTVYGSSSGAFATGPLDWGVSLSWDLGDLIFNDDQTSIDSRSKMLVELRNDILAEATRLYFERRKLQYEIMGLGNAPSRSDKELKLQETTALLDRLTGGCYSRVLKSVAQKA